MEAVKRLALILVLLAGAAWAAPSPAQLAAHAIPLPGAVPWQSPDTFKQDFALYRSRMLQAGEKSIPSKAGVCFILTSDNAGHMWTVDRSGVCRVDHFMFALLAKPEQWRSATPPASPMIIATMMPSDDTPTLRFPFRPPTDSVTDWLVQSKGWGEISFEGGGGVSQVRLHLIAARIRRGSRILVDWTR